MGLRSVALIALALACGVSALSYKKVHLVDHNTETGNYLFRGDMPCNDTAFDIDNLIGYMRERASDAGVPLPADFYLIDIMLNNIFDEKAFELDYWANGAHASEGELWKWPIGLAGVLPPWAYNQSEADKLALADVWKFDQLPTRLQQTHEQLNSYNSDGRARVMYVHCTAGCDRTGEFVGSYRMQFNAKNTTEMYALDTSECGRSPNWYGTNGLEWYCLYFSQTNQTQIGDCETFATCKPFGDCQPATAAAPASNTQFIEPAELLPQAGPVPPILQILTSESESVSDSPAESLAFVIDVLRQRHAMSAKGCTTVDSSAGATSCGSCTGCTTGTAAATLSADESETWSELQARVMDAQRRYSVPLTEEDADEWDLFFNDVGMRIARANAQAVKPLLAIYQELGPKAFLQSANDCIRLGLFGALLCWAFEHTEQQPKRLSEVLAVVRTINLTATDSATVSTAATATGGDDKSAVARDSKSNAAVGVGRTELNDLLIAVNAAAARHEMFAANRPVGRTITLPPLPPPVTTTPTAVATTAVLRTRPTAVAAAANPAIAAAVKPLPPTLGGGDGGYSCEFICFAFVVGFIAFGYLSFNRFIRFLDDVIDRAM